MKTSYSVEYVKPCTPLGMVLCMATVVVMSPGFKLVTSFVLGFMAGQYLF